MDGARALLQAVQEKITLLEKGDHTVKHQSERTFPGWVELICETEPSLAARPSSTRALRKRAQSNLREISDTHGYEVFVLCTLSTTRTRFWEFDHGAPAEVLKELDDKSPWPEALCDVTAKLKQEYPDAFRQWKVPSEANKRTCRVRDVIELLGEKGFWDRDVDLVCLRSGSSTIELPGLKISLSNDLTAEILRGMHKRKETQHPVNILCEES